MQAREKFVKDALSDFLILHSSGASLGDIDDVVLSYVISILEELGSGDSVSEEIFDIEQFIEMMDAYLPGFHAIDSIIVSEWMFELASSLANQHFSQNGEGNELAKGAQSATSTFAISSNSLNSLARDAVQCSVPTNEEKSCCVNNVDLLIKMFPYSSIHDIERAISISAGQLDEAVDRLLEQYNDNENSADICQCEAAINSPDKTKDKNVSLKKSILEKYSYVDTEEDKKIYKPAAPKKEPKKMIRYLDGRVVSVKGERFTEIKKPEDEAMKSTYVNLKPARQYRFH